MVRMIKLANFRNGLEGKFKAVVESTIFLKIFCLEFNESRHELVLAHDATYYQRALDALLDAVSYGANMSDVDAPFSVYRCSLQDFWHE